MNFALDDDQQAIVQMVRELARAERPPTLAALAELGLFGIMASERSGGVGLGLLDASVCLEELATRHPSLARTLQVHNALTLVALAGVDPAAVAPLASGEALGSAGHRVGSVVRAVPHGARASVVLALSTEGAWLVRDAQPVGEAGEWLGLRATMPRDLSLDGATPQAIPAPLAARATAAGDAALAAVAVGIGRGALEHSLRYASERTQFGKPIGAFQAIQHKLADSATALDAARLMAHRAAWLWDDERDASVAARRALRVACEAAELATDHGVQIHGGYGYVTEFPVESLYRDARACSLFAGPQELAPAGGIAT